MSDDPAREAAELAIHGTTPHVCDPMHSPCVKCFHVAQAEQLIRSVYAPTIERLTRERDEAADMYATLLQAYTKMQAERDAMRRVVEAARSLREACTPGDPMMDGWVWGIESETAAVVLFTALDAAGGEHPGCECGVPDCTGHLQGGE